MKSFSEKISRRSDGFTSKSFLVSLLVSSLTMTGCAHRYRSVDSGKSQADVTASLSTAIQSLSGSTNASFLNSISSDANASVYYFDAGVDPSTNIVSALGDVGAEVANDFYSLSGVPVDQLTFAQGYFVVRPAANGGYESALIIGYSTAAATTATLPSTTTTLTDGSTSPVDQTIAADATNNGTTSGTTGATLTYVVYVTDSSTMTAGSIQDGEFTTLMQGGASGATSPMISVSTFDLNSDESNLAKDIQLTFSDSQTDADLGQINSLEGF